MYEYYELLEYYERLVWGIVRLEDSSIMDSIKILYRRFFEMFFKVGNSSKVREDYFNRVEYLIDSEREIFNECWDNDKVDIEKLKEVIRNDIIENLGGIKSDFYWSNFLVNSESYWGILKSIGNEIVYIVNIEIL